MGSVLRGLQPHKVSTAKTRDNIPNQRPQLLYLRIMTPQLYREQGEIGRRILLPMKGLVLVYDGQVFRVQS